MSQEEQEALLRDWSASSSLLYYTVICVSVVTLPALIFMLIVLRKYSKSNYYCFLCSIIIGNFILLGTIFTNVLSDRNMTLMPGILPGVVVCKLSAFLVNTSSFFVHWAWVAMYAQRFIHVFFPLRAHRANHRSKEVIGILCAFSIISQLWTPVLITELSVGDDVSFGTYCAEDPRIFGETTLKYLIFFECFMTFILPFVLTVIADFSVLIMRSPCSAQTSFTLISADEIVHHEHESDEKSPLKIVHKSKIMFDMRRRNEAIRRCLLLATVTLLLNLPNYSLQLIDEYCHFRDSDDLSIRRKFIRADAVVYIIYLLQFPTVPIYMYCLKNDFDRSKSKTRCSGRRSTTDSYV
uniref:G_PROTEIN_RECEP_F1_2 domain-containing protein n=1 Tax=Caenorhabditis japonica TaxID=281687 RepID=A0A8R1DHU3_CAEJA